MTHCNASRIEKRYGNREQREKTISVSNLPTARILGRRYSTKYSYQLAIGNLRRGFVEVMPKTFANNKGWIVDRSLSIRSIPLPESRSRSASVARIEQTVAVIEGHCRVATNPTVARKSPPSLSIPFGTSVMRRQHLQHAKYGSHSAVTLPPP